MNEQGRVTYMVIYSATEMNKYPPLCPFLFSVSQENAAVMRVIPLILSINTSVFAATGVETKGKSCLLCPLVSKNSLALR